MKILRPATVPLLILLAAGCVKARPPATVQLPRRDLTLVFQTEVPSIPAGAKQLTLWVPVPRDERVQVLRSVASDAQGAAVVSDERGNPALKIVVEGPAATVSARVTVAVSRVEERGTGELRSHPLGLIDFSREDRPEQWLADDGLTVVDATVREIAADLYQGAPGDEAKARAAFEYVLAHMRYSKEGKGWGTGSTAWACNAKYGNCTDFHALFIALLRAGGVPARFRIGFPLPPGPGRGEIGGYHCWAEWWSKERGWVPVDASEAWKHPDKRDYLFGNLDPDRVGVSLGRDIRFAGQAAPPLNYFVFPYAEVDGAPVPVTTHVTWEEKG